MLANEKKLSGCDGGCCGNKVFFGTDGIRGNADNFPFVGESLVRLSRAIAKWSIEKYEKKPVLLIGMDTRVSSPRFFDVISTEMAKDNVVIFDGGVLPTPAVCQLIKCDTRFDFGIMISASHNPYYDNGIKLFDAKDEKIGSADENRISYLFETENNESSQQVYLAKNENLNTLVDAAESYAKRVCSFFPSLNLKDVRIVIDCANGTTSGLAARILRTFGAEVISIADEPTGFNINDKCGALYPLVLRETVLAEKATMGFAFDGDGDRVVVVNCCGRVLDGDDVLWLISTLPEFSSLQCLVGTVMSNLGLEQALSSRGICLFRSEVGDKNVSDLLKQKQLILGGEPSGHTILRNYLASSDGIFVALKVAEAIKVTENGEMKTFVHLPQVAINIPIKIKTDLSKEPLGTIIEEAKNRNLGTKIIVRYSGTEMLLRIMVESSEESLAKSIASGLVDELKACL